MLIYIFVVFPIQVMGFSNTVLSYDVLCVLWRVLIFPYMYPTLSFLDK
jgi:hypothetical protein